MLENKPSIIKARGFESTPDATRW